MGGLWGEETNCGGEGGRGLVLRERFEGERIFAGEVEFWVEGIVLAEGTERLVLGGSIWGVGDL